ncbi:MAG: hypothetical protein R3B89_15110 [Polyangiaceae bacterium]
MPGVSSRAKTGIPGRPGRGGSASTAVGLPSETPVGGTKPPASNATVPASCCSTPGAYAALGFGASQLGGGSSTGGGTLAAPGTVVAPGTLFPGGTGAEGGTGGPGGTGGRSGSLPGMCGGWKPGSCDCQGG